MSGLFKAMALSGGLVLAWGISPADAHCQYRPEVTLNHITDGVTEQVQCLFQSVCVRDTFYRDSLLENLHAMWNSHSYAVAGIMDSLTIRRIPLFNPFDSTDIWDTLRTERVWITITDHLKGDFALDSLVLDDFWPSANELPPIATYDSILRTPFIAFFDSADSMKRLGLGPVDGCFFEPTGYYVFNDCIVKLGNRWSVGDGGRMPGVSVPVEDFTRAVGIGGIELADERGRFKPWPSPILELRINRTTTSIAIAPVPFHLLIYDIRGRLISRKPVDPRDDLNLRIQHIPSGTYWLRVQGDGWDNTAPLVVKGGRTFLNTDLFPKGVDNTGCVHD